ncbi:MAG: hypothetical protein M0P40_08710 [Bacteroidales bacterium]|jgi:hypothetical protein|nr:hypothetical protein [Bacteroidales bacterium]MDD2265036.1 hypothetical protein [Bacteroidales bacterium]MDD2832222.1 hypothetical protein [Bacteroidales bacterium]MDD4474024.1 hypothetical protein [Bacteroidales bacterium]MDD5047001.1 hypothetical protein [Bacteroidales bacterium]
MIAATIGRTFLNAWNEKYQKEYSAKEFFENDFIPIFFDHPKYLMTGGNSPLENPKIQWKKGKTLSAEERKDRIEKTLDKINSNSCDASIALGFPASEENEFATTSGLVTDIELQHSPEDKMLSWIGGGLGIGVAGGYSIFFDHPGILLTLYDGWKVYRRFLNDPTLDKMRGNQINTWNGQWLNYAYSSDSEENPDFGYLLNYDIFTQNEKLIEVNTIFWAKFYFNLSEKLNDETVTAYVYSLGQTNKTLGFIPFRFYQGRSILNIYKILFGENDALKQKKDYESLFGIHIKRACELGAVGLQALEPNGLREYFDKAKMPDYSTKKMISKKGESSEAFEERRNKSNQKEYENLISFRTYKTWLLAMITKNKQEDLHYSEEVAIALKKFRADAKKRDRANLIEKELLQAKTKKQFLDGLASLIKDVEPELFETIKVLRDKVHLMNAEDFGYFVVLLKFDYAYQEKKS